MDQALKEKIAKLYARSKELDSLQEEVDVMRAELVVQLRERGLTKTKFDFADKVVKYRKYVDHGQISQKLLREVLKGYPEVDGEGFMAQVLSARPGKDREVIEILKK